MWGGKLFLILCESDAIYDKNLDKKYKKKKIFEKIFVGLKKKLCFDKNMKK